MLKFQFLATVIFMGKYQTMPFGDFTLRTRSTRTQVIRIPNFIFNTYQLMKMIQKHNKTNIESNQIIVYKLRCIYIYCTLKINVFKFFFFLRLSNSHFSGFLLGQFCFTVNTTRETWQRGKSCKNSVNLLYYEAKL